MNVQWKRTFEMTDLNIQILLPTQVSHPEKWPNFCHYTKTIFTNSCCHRLQKWLKMKGNCQSTDFHYSNNDSWNTVEFFYKTNVIFWSFLEWVEFISNNRFSTLWPLKKNHRLNRKICYLFSFLSKYLLRCVEWWSYGLIWVLLKDLLSNGSTSHRRVCVASLPNFSISHS